MHEVYNIATINDCYDKIIDFISSAPNMELVMFDSFSTAFFVVKSGENKEFTSFAQSKGYTAASLATVPEQTIISPAVNIDFSVFHNKLSDYYVMIALDKTKKGIYITVSDTYSAVYNPFTQKYSAYARQIKAYSKGTNIYFCYYTSIACLFIESANTTLHCNYNDKCFAFSTIDETDVTRHTFNAFFGMLRVHRPYNGGLYLAGNACGYLETIERYSYTTQAKPGQGTFGYATYIGTTISLIQDCTYADIAWHFRTDHPNDFYADLTTASDWDQMNRINSRPKKSYYNNFDVFVRLDVDAYYLQEMYWASNLATKLANNKFIILYASYSTDDIALPTYKNLVSNSVVDTGRAINQLNGISMVMPVYLMVKRQPVVLNTYAAIGYMDYVSYVSMYNCSSGSMNDLEYPAEDETAKYECFALYRRRGYDVKYEMPWIQVRDGMKGYNGFAIRQFTKKHKLVDWYILTELRRNHDAWEIFNYRTGIKAYQGTLELNDIKDYKYAVNYRMGYLPLTSFFTYYDNIIVQYTDDAGESIKEYMWNPLDLKAAVDTEQAFNLIGDNSSNTYIFVSFSLEYPFRYAQLSIQYTSEDCGLVDIIGY